MSFRYGEAITIVRPDAPRDRFGDRPGGPTGTRVDGVGFAFDSTSASWPQEAEDRGLAQATLFLPKGTDIRKGDTIIRVADGSKWHLVGRTEWDHSVQPQTGWDSGMFTQRVREVT
ncbi:hypothetical protein FK268_09185 [Tsukamurella sputi]|uniref:Head-to-tail stopper n=1 Tax=Tsukamurella sputi TaxID=2591848 RepID=A0A5C5RTG8_9ACTN|nr:hypothetical protein [Tsukamurella sputi]TWS25355.1 hypothetical protein FK268_09185 [Tsukamurella sputi]